MRTTLVIKHTPALQPLWRRCQERVEDTELCQEWGAGWAQVFRTGFVT
jgi:hypothetical protein